jgi:hypothetical protein
MAEGREDRSTASCDEEEWLCCFLLPFFGSLGTARPGKETKRGEPCFLRFAFIGYAGDGADEESSSSLEEGTRPTSSSLGGSVCMGPPGFSVLEELPREALRLVGVSPGRARAKKARPRIEGQRD